MDNLEIIMTELDRITDTISDLAKKAEKSVMISKSIRTDLDSVIMLLQKRSSTPIGMDEDKVIDGFLSQNYESSNIATSRVKRKDMWEGYRIFANSMGVTVPTQKKFYIEVERMYGLARRLVFPDGATTFGFTHVKSKMRNPEDHKI